jgi:chorismate synthase
MASNSFGTLFRITTWGESHGKAIGVVIDGCPAGLEVSEEDIQIELARRSPGKSIYTSPRKEEDKAEILSGVFDGKTTGAPISIVIFNKDFDSSKYEPIKHLLRPGHASYTYQEKYGLFDHRGGGRASARETACRVAAGAIAKKLLKHFGIEVVAFLSQVEKEIAEVEISNLSQIKESMLKSSIFCPDAKAEIAIMEKIASVKEEGDSLGGIVVFTSNLPLGLGDPIYEKLEAKLGAAMLSIPASKGFEIGSGFSSVFMKGSCHNDIFRHEEGRVVTKTNHAGGILAGISTGMPLIGRVVFKPTSSIKKPQETLNVNKEKELLTLPEGSRHDPCVAVRAVPVVEAMAALVLADAYLLNRNAKL